MQINWCLKGIAETASFGDVQAEAVLSSTGILSRWMISNAALTNARSNIDGQSALNATALDNHVNNYASVAATTPYISLSSGCNEYAGRALPPIRYPALRTALRFATTGGKNSGYVFRCWVVTGLKPAPELPGQAEEVRDLNTYAQHFPFHRQGEVTAKLVVPRRQIHWVMKFDKNLGSIAAGWTGGGGVLHNPEFVPSHRVSNIIQELI